MQKRKYISERAVPYLSQSLPLYVGMVHKGGYVHSLQDGKACKEKTSSQVQGPQEKTPGISLYRSERWSGAEM